MLTVHGRKRALANECRDGPADLTAIAAIKKVVSIPVVSNGNVTSFADILSNLAETGGDGAMVVRNALLVVLIY